MGLFVHASSKQHLFNSTKELRLSLVNDNTGAPVLGASPTVAIRRASDGYFFNGAAFVDTSGTPTNLAMTEIGSTSAPGLYSYTFADPGPIVPTPPAIQLSHDTYEIRFVNAGAPPTGGTLWDIREFMRQLRDINTQGS